MATNAAPPADQTSGSTANNKLTKDEVAWFFVEQYYTTLSRTPEKLHLFYGNRSQFVYGQEAEVTGVSVGRQAIQQRIKALDFSDSCKVRISNVDSMNTDASILIQVIGEMSKKAGEDPKKFVQSFVLAQQPSGFFVLNDILRYMDEEDIEEEQQEEATGQESAELPQNSAAETHEELEVTTKPEPVAEERTTSAQLDPEMIDEKLEEVATKDTPPKDESAIETPAEPAAATQETVETGEGDPRPDPDKTVHELADEDSQEAEKPTDPSTTPVTTHQPPAPAAAPAPAPVPAQPPKPKTWANLAAAAAGPRPAPALPKTVATPASALSRPAAQASATPSQPTEAPATSAVSKESSEWQTAGSESKRQNRPQSISGQTEKEGALGYVKYVTEKVNAEELKNALSKHGDLVYFDINRTKSCAFVEFATPAGYQAAAAANPHIVNGEQITVEPRRPKANAFGGANYSTGRGGMPNKGVRGGLGGQGGRGGFQNRGRGGPPRGRGGMQAANA